MGIAYNTRVIRDGLSFHLDFANPKSYPGSGTAVTDLTKTGNLSTQGAPVFNGTYMYFRGEGAVGGDDRVDVYNSSIGDLGTSSYSFQILINPKTTSSSQNAQYTRIYEQLGWPDTYHLIQVLDSSKSYNFGVLTNGGVNTGIATPDNTVILNEWTFLTAVLDRDNSKLRFFVKDAKYEANLNTAGPTDTIGNADPIQIPSGYSAIEADISCVLAYNRALSDQEVVYNYNALRGRFGI